MATVKRINMIARIITVAALATLAAGQQGRRFGGFGGGNNGGGGGSWFAGGGGGTGSGGGSGGFSGGFGGRLENWADRFGGGRSSTPTPAPNQQTPAPGTIPRTTSQTQASFTQNTQANDVRGGALGTSFNIPGASGGGQGARAAFAAAAAAPASVSLGTGAAGVSGGGPLVSAALQLRNACAGTTLQAAARVADATGGWHSVGPYELKPGATADVGTVYGSTAYVFAREAGGRSCDGGGRCWRGEAGPWPLPGDAAKGTSEKFLEVRLPDGQSSYTHSFEC